MTPPIPPDGLEAAGNAFWSAAIREREFEEAHDLERLRMAARCLDELASDEAAVKAEGRFFPDRFGQPREHPAAKAIRDNKLLFIKIVRELGLDLVLPGTPHAPRRY